MEATCTVSTSHIIGREEKNKTRNKAPRLKKKTMKLQIIWLKGAGLLHQRRNVGGYLITLQTICEPLSIISENSNYFCERF